MKISILYTPMQRLIYKPANVMRITGLFLGLLVTAGWMPTLSQQTKTPVQLGDEYFAAGEYYTAAHLYEQFLNPSKKQKTASGFPLNSRWKGAAATGKNISRTDILYKQAESYRLANYWEDAATSYKEYADKKPDQYADALYWYAVCKRSLGQYDSAEASLKLYLSEAGANSQYRGAAEKELKTLGYIRQQLARPDSILVKSIQKVDAPNSSEKGVYAPVHVGGDKFLFSSTRTDSVQTAGVNPHHSRLFYATLNNGSLAEMSPATLSVSSPLNNQGAAAISADGNHLYFSEWRNQNGRTVSFIYHSVKQDSGWSLPVLLPSINVTGFNSKQPFCSADGKYLFFASDRPGGSGKFDIWYAPLKKDGTAGDPVNAGKVINTTGDEQAPFYHNSSTTLVFSSNGPQGMGGYDLFAAKGSEATWNSPENMGHPINSSRDDIYFFAPENKPLLSNAVFSSDRGTGCCLETYTISKAAKNKRITGIVRDCKDNTPIANAEVTLKDVSGKTWNSTTDLTGQYKFELGTETYEDLTLIININRELYQEKSTSFTVAKTDESDLMIDNLINTDLCISKTPVITRENVVILYFDFDKSDLKQEGMEKLDSVCAVLAEYPSATIQVGAHTDGFGSDEYNKVLADKRAKACVDYLSQKGIDVGRITYQAFGECCPAEAETIDGRDNPDGRSRNRRALIHVNK